MAWRLVVIAERVLDAARSPPHALGDWSVLRRSRTSFHPPKLPTDSWAGNKEIVGEIEFPWNG
jgi:hypothetical protein